MFHVFYVILCVLNVKENECYAYPVIFFAMNTYDLVGIFYTT